MTVKELIEKLEKMPQYAEVLRYDNEYFHEEIEVTVVRMRGEKVEIE